MQSRRRTRFSATGSWPATASRFFGGLARLAPASRPYPRSAAVLPPEPRRSLAGASPSYLLARGSGRGEAPARLGGCPTYAAGLAGKPLWQGLECRMEKNRLEAFSDGVLAIIITVMVLELKVPHGSDLTALKPLLPVFLTYLLSFIYRWDLLEQPSSPAQSGSQGDRRHHVGEPPSALLAVALPLRHRLDGREPLHTCAHRALRRGDAAGGNRLLHLAEYCPVRSGSRRRVLAAISRRRAARPSGAISRASSRPGALRHRHSRHAVLPAVDRLAASTWLWRSCGSAVDRRIARVVDESRRISMRPGIARYARHEPRIEGPRGSSWHPASRVPHGSIAALPGARPVRIRSSQLRVTHARR